MPKIRRDPTLGQNIKALRNRAGLTQEQVIAQMQIRGCSITRSIYSQIELGTYSIRPTELSALAKIFKCDYNAFFAGLEKTE